MIGTHTYTRAHAPALSRLRAQTFDDAYDAYANGAHGFQVEDILTRAFPAHERIDALRAIVRSIDSLDRDR